LALDRLVVGGEAARGHLLAPPPRALVEIRVEVELHLGLGTDDAARVATPQYHAGSAREPALERGELVADDLEASQPGRQHAQLRSAELRADVLAVDDHAAGLEVDRGLVEHAGDGARVVRGDPRLPDRPGERAIEGARVHELEAEAAGELARGRRFAGRRRSGDRDHGLPLQGSSSAQMCPARELTAATKPGYEVLMQPVSSTIVSPSAMRPATTSAMAMRWSPPLPTVAPRSRVPPSMSRPSGRSTTRAPMRP